MEPVFIVPKNKKQSYEDYYELINFCEFKTISDSFERQDNFCYILPLHHTVSPMGDKGKVVLWFLERPESMGGIPGLHVYFEKILKQNNVQEIWLSDKEMFSNFDCDLVKFVPFGSDERLGTPSDEKIYDVADMCYRHTRRNFINALKCKLAPGAYGQEKKNILSSSKFLLNVHQDNDLYYEPLRFALAVANGLPIITEDCYNPYPFVSGDFVSTNIGNLPTLIEDVVSQPYNKWRDLGLKMRDKILANFSFQKNIEKALL
jgi:hypothetical protein